MPKIIENVREQLLNEAKRQIESNGYSKTTIRSVAGACGLATGTVYNYFPSKDMLIASFMLDDWNECLDKIKGRSNGSAKELMSSIYEFTLEFIGKHRSLFEDADAIKSFNSSHNSRHSILRSQIAAIIYPVCKKGGKDPKFLSEFIAESLLCWTIEGKSFDEIYSVLQMLFE